MRTPSSERLHGWIQKALSPEPQRSPSWELFRAAGYTDELGQAILDDGAGWIEKGGELVSVYTHKLALNNGFPEIPPAFIRPGRLKVGDRVVALNWYPTAWGTKLRSIVGREIDGRVDKILPVRCKVAKCVLPFDEWPGGDTEYEDEDRVYALGIRAGSKIVPVVLKDYSVVISLPGPATNDPSGLTNQRSMP